jgi:branched-chain amino acid transport system ATP-binding protein
MPDLLNIENLSAGYGEAVVLSGISLSLAEGQALALLGRNGMGKTTLINTIVGVTRYFSGKIALDGRDMTKLRPDQRAHAGVGWVPQERNIFKSLTVHENLTAVARPGRWTTDKVYAMFPRLNERRKTSATSFRAASNKCSRWHARWCLIRGSCCSMNRSKAWRRSLSMSC